MAARDRIVRAVGAPCTGLVDIGAADLVIGDLADEGRPQPQIAEPRHGVGDRPAGDAAVVGKGMEQHLRAVHLDQLHDALLDRHLRQERVLNGGDHVHHGIADPDNIIFHSVFSSKSQRSRIRQAAHLGLRAVQV